MTTNWTPESAGMQAADDNSAQWTPESAGMTEDTGMPADSIINFFQNTGKAGAQGLSNFAGNILQDIGTAGQKVGMPYAQNFSQGGQNVMNWASKAFPSQTSGLQGYADEAAKNIGQGLPYAFVPGGMIAQGALYGATQSAPGQALPGALGSAVFGVLGKGIGKGAESLVGNALLNLKEPIEADLDSTLRAPQEKLSTQAYQSAQDNYNNIKSQSRANYDTVGDMARQYDNSSQTPTPDFSNYQNYLQGRIAGLQNDIKLNPANAALNKPAINLLTDLSNTNLDSYSQAMNHLKTINNYHGTTIVPASGQLLSTPERTELQNAEGVFRNNLDQNLSDPQLEPLKNALNNANQNYQAQKALQQTTSPKAQFVKNVFARMLNVSPDNLVLPFEKQAQLYAQSAKSDLPNFFNQVGNPDLAKAVAKQNIFSDVYADNTFNPSKAVSVFQKLPQSDKNLLFSPDEQQKFNALSVINRANKNQSGLNPSLTATLLGAALAPHIGASAAEGGALGLAAQGFGQGAIHQAAQIEPFKNAMINSLMLKAGAPAGAVSLSHPQLAAMLLKNMSAPVVKSLLYPMGAQTGQIASNYF